MDSKIKHDAVKTGTLGAVGGGGGESGPGPGAANCRAKRKAGRSGSAALEYLKNGGPLVKGNVASENLDQWFKDILHDFTVKNIEHMSR